MTIEKTDFRNTIKGYKSIELGGTSNVNETPIKNQNQNQNKNQKTNNQNLANGALFSAINTLKL
jgi:hypothetical protein